MSYSYSDNNPMMPMRLRQFCRYLCLAVPLLASLNTGLSQAAVILQYHHVDSTTPRSTSITPQQFARHLAFIQQQGFHVLPLSALVQAIQQRQVLPDKTLAITFDDGYQDVMSNAKPLLDNYHFPYTIFVNPGQISDNSGQYLSWQQLRQLSSEGVLIGNHGYHHDSLIRKPANLSAKAWQQQQHDLLLKAEETLNQKLGQSPRYFAYPYGEYQPVNQRWLRDLDIVGFSQQSGAVGRDSDLSALPRFPLSWPYDDLASLADKLNALPFNLTPEQPETVMPFAKVNSATFSFSNQDIAPEQLRCYLSGRGRQPLHWLSDSRFRLDFEPPLPPGRNRVNCTAPSRQQPTRFYWYSKPWFVSQQDGQWYPF